MLEKKHERKKSALDWGGVLLVIGLAGIGAGLYITKVDPVSKPLIGLGLLVALFLMVWGCAKITERTGRPWPLYGVISFGDKVSFNQRLSESLMTILWVPSALNAYSYASCVQLFGDPEDWHAIWADGHNPFDIVTNYPVFTGFVLDIPLKICLAIAAITLVLLLFRRDAIPWFLGRATMFFVLVGFFCAIGALLGTVLGFLGHGAHGPNLIGRFVALVPIELFLFILVLLGSVVMCATGLDRVSNTLGAAASELAEGLTADGGGLAGFMTGDVVYDSTTGTNQYVQVDGDYIHIGGDTFYPQDIAGQSSFIGASGHRYTR